MGEKSEVQDVIFNKLVENNAIVARVNGGKRGKIPFYFWKARYLDDYWPLPDVLQNAYEFCAELRRDLIIRPRTLSKGVADLMGTLDWGQAFVVECKAPGQLTKWSSQEQALFLIEQYARGAAVGVFDNPTQFDPWRMEMRRIWILKCAGLYQ